RHTRFSRDSSSDVCSSDLSCGRVAELLTDVTRPQDVVGRFGGEEFLVLISDVDALQAYHTAERIRHRVATSSITTRGKSGEPVTITDRTTSIRSEGHTSELQSREILVCRLLLEK